MTGRVYLLFEQRSVSDMICRAVVNGRWYIRSGSHLSALALEAPDTLLPPFSSHRERLIVEARQQNDGKKRIVVGNGKKAARHNTYLFVDEG